VIFREFEINRRFAPDLYLGVQPITRAADGSLEIGGAGVPIEWALHMRRFRDADMLGAIIRRGAFQRDLQIAVSGCIWSSHQQSIVLSNVDGAAHLRRVLDQVSDGLDAETGALPSAACRRFRDFSTAAWRAVEQLLQRRARDGRVRRCHGDLHIGNIVVWQGRPLLFDALEFSEDLASVDTLYDLAFLLMDLDSEGQRAAANMILNRYLISAGLSDVEGLAALPLFLALRAGIRAMVGAERARQEGGEDGDADVARARRYLQQALDYLEPAPSRLIVIGGFSGTGKSTLASALAPMLGVAPGALHIRADAERKAMFGVAETERLPSDTYTIAASDRVYALMMDKARRALAAGQSVVIDAVFSRSEERAVVEALAREADVPLTALWLTAPREVMLSRVQNRRNDASDATADVLEAQLARGAGEVDWIEIVAAGNADETLAAATRHIGI
jgi:aminoglycoside phosphotransferase family enzyme/predicted kinase